MRDTDDRIDYQINKILYHFNRLKYLGGVRRALQALEAEGYLDITNFLIEKKTTNPSDGRTMGARQNTATNQPTAQRHSPAMPTATDSDDKNRTDYIDSLDIKQF